MSYSIKFVVSPLPVSDDVLFDRIKESIFINHQSSGQPPIVSQQTQSQSQPQTNPRNSQLIQSTFNAIKSVPVRQITVGPRHIAILLEDGRVCRAPYQIQAERLEFPPAPLNTAQIPSMTGNSSHPSASHHPSHNIQQALLSHNTSGSQVSTITKAPIGSSGGPGSAAPGSSTLPTAGNPSNLSNVVISSGLASSSGIDARSVAGPNGGNQSGAGQIGGSSGVPGSGVPPFAGRVNISPQSSGLSIHHRQVARRGRMLRHTASRARTTSVIMNSRAMIPAHYVPEDLINQAQVVLQGKPRSAIVRELQRTNLDVNSAVNNLLSSDNEDPEDIDESQDYMPHEDLMSLLDSSVSLPGTGPTSVLIDAETVFPEDVFNSYSASRIRSSNIRHSIGSGRGASDRESSLASELEIRRMAGRDPSQSRRWLEHALRDPPGSDSPNSRLNSATPTDFTLHNKNDSNHGQTSKKTQSNSFEGSPIQISDTIEIWPCGDKKFTQIASMHSELIAVSSSGKIHQWKWADSAPFEGVRHGDSTNYHPKLAQLNLTNEKVQFLSASCIRATVVTETSKVATWIDDSISLVGGKLEHGAQSFPEFQRGDKIAQLQTCSLYSCVRLESGQLYWWGVAPFSQRKKNWKKMQSKVYKHGTSSSNLNDITVGSIVCLRNGPSFVDGAVGFTTKDGIPRVGRLTMSAWNITDTCTFKIMQPTDRKSSTSQSSEASKTSSSRNRKILGHPLDFSSNAAEEQSPNSPGMSKNSSSERLEMPPPPSPASSTCSEPGCSPSHKRKQKHTHSSNDDKCRDEEQWNLRDVIFLEEVKKPPAARVVKLDGNTALVRFNQRDPFGNQSDSDVNAYLQDCRMIRKDELQLAKETTSSPRIIDCQRSPKKLNIPDSVNFLTFVVSSNGIHAVVRNGQRIEYKVYQLASGRISKSLFFSTDVEAFIGRDPSLITLFASGENDVAVTLRDGNGSLYPLAKDFVDSLKEPQPLDMAPVQALSMAVHPVRDPHSNRFNPTLVMAMALENQILIPAILRSDPEFVRLTLASLEQEPVSQQIVASEKIDLNRNILHAAVYSCASTPSKTHSESNRSFTENSFESFPAGFQRFTGTHNDSLKKSRIRPSTLAANSNSSTLDLSSDSDNRSMQGFAEADVGPQTYETPAGWSNSIFGKYDIDPSEQKQSAHIVLLILVDCPSLRPYLKDLMMQIDAYGMTPFMSAVSNRAYTAALILMDLSQWIISHEENLTSDDKQRLFSAMTFPPGTNLDNNPLYMLCANDTCSFTWTGAQHINQDIFECKTCGLTRTLCCCTECARTCHKGHDCRLKRTSPTAYCDCWEKCKCKSLVSGSQTARFKLLERLLSDTDFVTYPDSKGESILLFLVQTVGRQMVEQRQYGPDRSRHKRDEPADVPDHDLSPPRFARKALHKLLDEWLALKTVMMAGTSSTHNLANATRVNQLLNAEDQIFLSNQQGTALLDRFTHSLLIKIGPEMLDVLLTTIIREFSSPNLNRVYEARLVAKRFVRSVARNGVVLSVELSPVNYSRPANSADLPNMFNQIASSPYGTSTSATSGAGAGSGGSWKQFQQPSSILQKCRKVFQALLPIAAEELAEIADALISPVRLGVPRPTAPFSLVNSMADATQGSEEIFVVEPVVLPSAASNVDPSLPTRQSMSAAPGPIGSHSSQSRSTTGAEQAPANVRQPPSSSVIDDRMRDLMYDNEIAMDAIDSEDAEASNNTFRPSNNGESDSDSDSNADDASFQSNLDPSGARSSATAATAGSEVGSSAVAYFSEADTGDSSNAEEEDESDANDTEQDADDINFPAEDNYSFSRRGMNALSNVSGSQPTNHPSDPSPQHHSLRAANLGQQLHWALRHREGAWYNPSSASMGSSSSSVGPTAARLASIGLANTYTYIDTSSTGLRRTVISGQLPPSSSGSLGGNNNNVASNNSTELSMSTTAVGLSRAFSIIIRSIADLIPSLRESERSDYALTVNQLRVSPAEAAAIILKVSKKLDPVWEWLFKVMDSTEGQLRFGCALTNGIRAAASSTSLGSAHLSTSAHSSIPGNLSNTSIHSAVPSTSAGLNIASMPSHSHQPPALNTSRSLTTTPQAPLNNPTLLTASSYFQSSGAPNLLNVHPAMLARVNANLSAHTLNRRVSNLLDESTTRIYASGSSTSSGVSASLPGTPGDTSSGRMHNPLNQVSVPSRPQSLTARANLSGSGYVSRMPPLSNETSEGSDSGGAARRDFLSYMISLIRGHGNEHHDSLPILDVSSLRHVAYVFDAYIYYLQALDREKTTKSFTDDWDEVDDQDQLSASGSSHGPKHQFFRRSESTLFLDSVALDPFNAPIHEALPLAHQPHLLQPNSRREDLFSMPKTNIRDINLDSLPMRLSLSSLSVSSCPGCIFKQQTSENHSSPSSIANTPPATYHHLQQQQGGLALMCSAHKREHDFNKSHEMQHTALLGRWRLTVELFGREFLDDVGAEPGSILTDLVGFPLKENRFRKDMERLRNDSAPREISLINIDRDKNTLIRQTIKELNGAYHFSERNQARRNNDLPLLACSKVKVSFKDEKGEGNGVARSFYTAFCEAVLSSEELTNLDSPLFYQPGLRNFYSPRQGDPTQERLNSFRNVGRIIGICLSQSEICPIQLNRHVIKYILCKQISWHDLAFFDPILYESLRQLVLGAQSGSSDLHALDLRFAVDLCIEEGGGQVELAPGGRDIEVTRDNIYEYVRRYALRRMIKSQERALQAIRQGVMDALPMCALNNMTAEDFRLLLNGVGEINATTLMSYTTFIDDRGTSACKRNSAHVDEQLGYFKKWFWSIVEKMTTKERQDLVYFWTGSPSLPASDEGFQPMPTVSIRPAEDLHLPTSNVCIFRLYIPLYSTKTILRSKLLIAIKEKNFGFI